MSLKRKILALYYALNLSGFYVNPVQISDRLSCSYDYAYRIITNFENTEFEDAYNVPSKINLMCPYCNR